MLALLLILHAIADRCLTMTDIPFFKQASKSGIWTRLLFMLAMALAFYLAASLLAILVVAQLILTISGDTPNLRLSRFGRMLGSYLRQIAEYETFASDKPPFPFSDWPDAK